MRYRVVVLVCLLTFLAVTVCYAKKDKLVVGNFSGASPGDSFPEGWEELTFEKIEKTTKYTLVKPDDQVVVKAVSRSSSSGMIKKIEIDPQKYPIVTWRWKVTGIYEKGNVRKKEGDDYPARLYITFKYISDKVGFLEKVKYEAVKATYGEYPPLAAINYIWASTASTGTIVSNPFVEKAKMVVVQSGKDKLNQWVTEKRNIVEDYKKAFGEDKTPPPISGVAIMTDSDNTQESATSYYGDIVFSSG